MKTRFYGGQYMKVPSTPFGLMAQIYRKVLPGVHHELNKWHKLALKIPDPELQKQALASIQSKTFHCEGGAIYSLLAQDRYLDVIPFIVAYQTISDYLDNLCDRSTSLDPEDFRALHKAMIHALTPGASPENYYRLRKVSTDGGYLLKLVKTCQSYLENCKGYDDIKFYLLELARYYCDLQVHKHVTKEERVPRLEAWFNQYKNQVPPMTWYEFSACSGSTLGIFCLVAYASAKGSEMKSLAKTIKEGYFPWVQGLHILMDYFIDQEEDKQGGDLNFCFYYPDDREMMKRFQYFIEQADISIKTLPNKNFHLMINRGLLSIYLADKKVAGQKNVRYLSRRLIKKAGLSGMFFFFNGWLYRRLKPSM